MALFLSMWTRRGDVKCPRLSTQGGHGLSAQAMPCIATFLKEGVKIGQNWSKLVKIGQNLVQEVVECPPNRIFFFNYLNSVPRSSDHVPKIENAACQLKRILSAYLLVISWSGWIASTAILSYSFSIHVEMFKKVMVSFLKVLVSFKKFSKNFQRVQLMSLVISTCRI